METEDLKMDSQVYKQLFSEQLPEILDAYEQIRQELANRYSTEFVENHPEVASDLTVALELKRLVFGLGEQLEKQTSGLVGSLHYLLDRDITETRSGQK